MVTRPTDGWRAGIAEEQRELASGTWTRSAPLMAGLFPESLLSRTDEVLSAFESEVGSFSGASDDQVLAAVERVVLALNAVNDAHGGSAYETGEREVLCSYIDGTLADAGIDVSALAARHGVSQYAITDQWRRW